MPHRGTVPLKHVAASLIYALDQRDPFGFGHSNRVAQYGLMIGKHLNFHIEQLAVLQYAALLHDIGKIGLPDFVLQSNEKFLEDEYLIMKEHPQIGALIVNKIDLFKVVEPAILQHHEWINGDGYPSHLKGDDICVEARIIAIVEAYDDMTTDQPYRIGMSPEKVLAIIADCANRQFDAYYVDVFTKLIEEDLYKK